MVLISWSKDESLKCKHLTIQVYQLMTGFLRSPILTTNTSETGGKPHHPSKWRDRRGGQGARQHQERGYTTAGRRHHQKQNPKHSY